MKLKRMVFWLIMLASSLDHQLRRTPTKSGWRTPGFRRARLAKHQLRRVVITSSSRMNREQHPPEGVRRIHPRVFGVLCVLPRSF